MVQKFFFTSLFHIIYFHHRLIQFITITTQIMRTTTTSKKNCGSASWAVASPLPASGLAWDKNTSGPV